MFKQLFKVAIRGTDLVLDRRFDRDSRSHTYEVCYVGNGIVEARVYSGSDKQAALLAVAREVVRHGVRV